MPKIATKPPETREEGWNRFFFTALRRNQTCSHLDLRLVASRTVRQYLLFKSPNLGFLVQAALRNEQGHIKGVATVAEMETVYGPKGKDPNFSRLMELPMPKCPNLSATETNAEPPGWHCYSRRPTGYLVAS